MNVYVGSSVSGQMPDNEGGAAAESTVEGYEIDQNSGVAYATGLTDAHCAYASWCHWGPLIASVSVFFTNGITFIIPPLVALAMWQIKNNDSIFIDDQGKEALNFQISIILLGLILIPISILTCGVGAVLYIGLPILSIVGGIMGGIAAAKAQYFRYPMCIRLI